MPGHSRFAPSAEDRNTICPGSFLLNERAPDRQSPEAAEGTAAHHVGALCLQLNHDVEVYAGCLVAVTARGECRFVHEMAPLDEHTEMGFEVDDEMLVSVQEYVDQCNALPGEHYVEVRVDHTDWCPDTDEFGDPLGKQEGTSDHIACIAAGVSDDYPESTIVVTDLKYGKGVMVFARENKQAIKYALGAWKEYDWIYGFKRVVVRISQPRLDHFDTWECSVEELLEHGAQSKKRLELVFVEDPPFQASEKGCKFCKVSATCRHLHEYLRATHSHHFDDLSGDPVSDPKLLSDEELMQAYYMIPLYKLAEKAIDRELFRRLANGQPVANKKIVASRQDRAWKDEQAVIAFARKKGLDDDRITTKKLVSPAQLEKLLPRVLWPEMEDLYERPPGGPCMVDASDPRPLYRCDSLVEHFDADDGF